MKAKNYSKKKYTNIIHFFTIFYLLLLLNACGDSSSGDANTHIDNTELSFRSIPLQSSIDRVQPMTGIVYWADNLTTLDDLGDNVQLEYAYVIYADVVNEKGMYDWTSIDSLLTNIEQRGHQAILRFRYTYPGKTQSSVPKYIETTPDYNSTIALVEGRNTYLPDWSFKGLEEFTLDFFSAFAKQYDNDPRIAFLQVGFGSYAEYHLYDGPVNLGQNFPSKAFQTDFLKHLHQEFKQLLWSFSIDAADHNYTPIAAAPDLQALNFGLFDDSFMHKMHSTSDDEYNRANWLFFGENRYKTNPAGGEFSYYSDYDQMNVLNPNQGSYGKSFEYFASLYHISYIIGNNQSSYQTPSRIKDAAMATGYKFKVEAFASSSVASKVVIKNIGIAPIYYDAYATVNGVRSSASLKGLLPNESKVFDVAIGGDNPILTIESDRLVPGQIIQFDANL
ncbi:hypothetical protein Q4506_02360 [Colwellia sp. 4_MG-2023]|uniref:hypothetical protein n=1 Tax=unclassified Colwellia TaxID=196834 RepID=UPI0026E3A7A7|nr:MULTISPECIES: hypothetical protein [unclassified Colwellia]MDO6505821.1 hypothetical protein [Colwellia sp. 5_MG-2023]MDO6554502.1 hypothetical protein [Colwellia sp. 4_MG-2023]